MEKIDENAFQNARNALLTVRILAKLQDERKNQSWLDGLLSEVERENAYKEKVPLVNQSTFLSMGYLTLLWLRESYFTEGQAKKILEQKITPIFNGDGISIKVGSKAKSIDYNKPIELIRRIRNSFGHASVEIHENHFVFKDKNPHNADDWAEISISWMLLGKLTEMVISAGNELLYAK